MTSIFADTTFQTANDYFKSVKSDVEKSAEAPSFVEGDDWRDGKNWTESAV